MSVRCLLCPVTFTRFLGKAFPANRLQTARIFSLYQRVKGKSKYKEGTETDRKISTYVDWVGSMKTGLLQETMDCVVIGQLFL